MSISIESSTSGYTNTLAKLVCRPPAESKGDLRTKRCTPVSVRNKPKAYSPSIFKVAPLMPATSPADSSSNVALKPLRSAYFRYCRKSMLAQSQASVPPAPAWISRKALRGSAGLLNIRRNSSFSTSDKMRCVSSSMVSNPDSSLSDLLMSNNSVLSAISWPKRPMVNTMSSRDFFSLPSSWAFLGSFQTLGSSREALTVLKRSDFVSKSKIPPKI